MGAGGGRPGRDAERSRSERGDAGTRSRKEWNRETATTHPPDPQRFTPSKVSPNAYRPWSGFEFTRRGYTAERPVGVRRRCTRAWRITAPMKHLICLIQNARRMAVLGLLYTGLGVGLHAGDTKPFKATGAVDPAMFSLVASGGLLEPFFVAVRGEHGPEFIAAISLQAIHSNVGGDGTALVQETIYLDPTGGPTLGFILWKLTTANGDILTFTAESAEDPVTLAFSGSWKLVPEKCTGRFAGATGQGTIAGDAVSFTYTMTGEITTVGSAGKAH